MPNEVEVTQLAFTKDKDALAFVQFNGMLLIGEVKWNIGNQYGVNAELGSMMFALVVTDKGFGHGVFSVAPLNRRVAAFQVAPYGSFGETAWTQQ